MGVLESDFSPDQCLVIGEITCAHMIVVLNKVDLVEESKREAHVAKVTGTYMYTRCQGVLRVHVHVWRDSCLDAIYGQKSGCGVVIS